jgi:hypothetical protein
VHPLSNKLKANRVDICGRRKGDIDWLS